MSPKLAHIQEKNFTAEGIDKEKALNTPFLLLTQLATYLNRADFVILEACLWVFHNKVVYTI